MIFSKTIIRGCGSIQINGKTYENINGEMTVTDNGVYINGKPIEEYKEPPRMELTIVGNVDEITTENVPIKVEGMVNTITSKNGDISVNGDVLGNVDSKNGNISVAGSIQGDATTKNGNIH